jgi:hypothetical protein
MFPEENKKTMNHSITVDNEDIANKAVERLESKNIEFSLIDNLNGSISQVTRENGENHHIK